MTTDSQTRLRLNDGRTMPQLGFGVWQIPNDVAPAAVREAIAAGYRLIDTAAGYDNEDGVGKGVAGLARDSLFVTTKLRNDNHGHDEALRAFDNSLARLKMDYVDLYLIHWPCPAVGRYVETWRAFIRLREEGRAKSIGVSNFTAAHIERLVKEIGVTPAINQIELHPRLQQREMRKFHDGLGIVTQSWSPLGRGRLDHDGTLAALAAKHRKTWAQVILRWHIQSGLSVIPKSVTPSRIRENIAVFDFELTPEDMAAIAALDLPNGRVGPHPDVMT